ncbi:LADA_0F15456g1_1 [Lachancea dasiensis]|uniref:LADA_0F15456g1_1 n=1 Tax=Lachancea dasiensis TaxID=1072105 RepID=A0A1G4JP11_9SACH|nr:LADA_0F15456g1_1 [Lachancea dasiensis]
MYIPQPYQVSDVAQQVELIENNPLGIMFSHAPESNGLLNYIKPSAVSMNATHVPFVIVKDQQTDKYRLLAHLSKNNQHAELLEKQPECLVVFQGPQSYISPSWYPLKKKTHKFVPTWDYSAVHVYGKAKIIRDDKDWLLGMLNTVTDQEEGKRPEGPDFEEKWTVSDAPSNYIDAMLRGIVGLEVEIDRFECQVKAHQKQDVVNVKGVSEGLVKECGAKGEAVANVMLSQHHKKDELQAAQTNKSA